MGTSLRYRDVGAFVKPDASFRLISEEAALKGIFWLLVLAVIFL